MNPRFAKLICLIVIMLLPSVARAGDGVTLVFRSGHVAYLGNGYEKILAAMETQNKKSGKHEIVKMTIGGGTFLLNISEIVIVCRDRCSTLKVSDFRDTSRSQ